MASVITVRVPDGLRRDMDSLGEGINWSEEVRRLLEKRVRQLAYERAKKLFHEAASGLPALPRGTVAKSIREDRDAR